MLLKDYPIIDHYLLMYGKINLHDYCYNRSRKLRDHFCYDAYIIDKTINNDNNNNAFFIKGNSFSQLLKVRGDISVITAEIFYSPCVNGSPSHN